MYILSEKDKQKLIDAYKKRWEILQDYNYEIDIQTQQLEQNGNRIIHMIRNNQLMVSNIRDFLKDVVSWKMPHKREEVIKNIGVNSDSEILSVFEKLQDPEKKLSNEIDNENIMAIIQLKGFQIRMASAVLRHLWPSFYGVLDWRNLAILSNCRRTVSGKASV